MDYKLPSGKYCAYLRKSRMDVEAEARGEEDTYTRHMKILMDMSKRYNITLTEIYKEKPATSGERITERPEMIRLLEDIENEGWAGCLVVEVERLARGDTMDQGIVAQAFKYSNTLIITPMRIYDPNNSDDEEYFEFGLFMSRREFKTITRRLQGGRLNSIKEGKFAGNQAPYGYNRIKLEDRKGFTLEPHPDQAPIVQMIFSMYTDPDPDKRKGTGLIARYLNSRNIPTARGGLWKVPTLVGMLHNATYAGYVRWGMRSQVKKRNSKSRPRKAEGEYTLIKGLHPPIIEESVYQRAQEIMKGKGFLPFPAGKISNPLAGLIRCEMCGGPIVLRPFGGRQPDVLICPAQNCSNVSTAFSLVEDKLLQSLHDWLKEYKAEWEKEKPEEKNNDQDIIKAKESVLRSLERQVNELQSQKGNLHDLLERQIYSVDEFMERSQNVTQRIEESQKAMKEAEEEWELEKKRITARVDIIPTVEHVLKMYNKTDQPAQKNIFLKSILEKVTYRKDKGGRWSGLEDRFTLKLYPKLSDQ